MELASKAELPIVCDFGLNIYNTACLESFEDCKAAVVSPEMVLSDAVRMGSDLPIGIISYGRLPLMITRNCPIKNSKECADCKKEGIITDRTNTSFPVRCRNGCSELLNSRPIWLADRKEEMSGLDFEILYFTDENPQRVDEIITAYSEEKAADCEYTRGLYFRGVE